MPFNRHESHVFHFDICFLSGKSREYTFVFAWNHFDLIRSETDAALCQGLSSFLLSLAENTSSQRSPYTASESNAKRLGRTMHDEHGRANLFFSALLWSESWSEPSDDSVLGDPMLRCDILRVLGLARFGSG